MSFLIFFVVLCNFLLTGLFFLKLQVLDKTLKDIYFCCDDMSPRLSEIKRKQETIESLLYDVSFHIKSPKRPQTLSDAKDENTIVQKQRGRPRKS